MKRFIKQLIGFVLILLIPPAVIAITYLYYDPFQVIYKYKSFFVSGKPRYVTLNYDYVAIETFLNNYPTYKYDSFIIGNSRTRFYEIDTWRKYINSDKCFHFDASAESLYGICKKMEFLHEKHVKITNALIILDHNTLLGINNSNGHLFISHPLLSGQNDFLRHYLDFKISGSIKEYMKKGHLLDDTPIDYDLKYNEMKVKIFEDIIKADPSKYYNEKRMKHFYQRDTIQQFSPEIIKREQIVMLNIIKKILKEHSTNFKIIISPLYDQLKLNKKDVEVLISIFGTENVYDFSGINFITSDYHNYYDNGHYRPIVADSILNMIYRHKPTVDGPELKHLDNSICETRTEE
jgi:hypothetical protein